MSENLLIIFIALGFWPFAVLMVARTGPHSAFERAEYERFKIERAIRKSEGAS